MVNDTGLGPRLKELREAAGMSQTELAKIAGVSRNAVSQWEAGRTQPNSRRLALISRALKVSLDRMMAPSTDTRDRVVELALRLIDRQGFEATTLEDVAAEAEISATELAAIYRSKEALLHDVLRLFLDRAFAEVRRMPPKYGSLLARLKYLLRTLATRDLAHLNLAVAFHAGAWRWSEGQEREHARQFSEFHETVVGMFDEAVAQRQIKPGQFRAASGLILAAYVAALRRAVFERIDAERLITLIEPQLAIVLSGFGYSDAYGFAEDANDKS